MTTPLRPGQYPEEAWGDAPTRFTLDGISEHIGPRNKAKRLISDEFVADGPMNYQSLLTSVYSPFIYNTLPSSAVRVCSLETFKRRYGVTSNILEPIEELYALGHNFVLAGGKMIDFVNNVSLEDSSNDYDCWFSDQQSYNDFENYIHTNWTETGGYQHNGHVAEFIFRNKKFQTITTLYAGPEHVIQSFDLRTCSVATDGKYVYWVKGAIHDIKKKRLVVINVQANKGNVLRIQKYIQRGYNISAPDFALASLSCLLSFDNHRTDVVNFFTQREQTLMEIMDASDNSALDYLGMETSF